jgi:hypothetical protein
MSWDWLKLQCAYNGVQQPSRHILYTLAGTFVDPWTGYPADLARSISMEMSTAQDENWYWQPVYYGPNGVPQAFPMQPSIDDGNREFARLLKQQSPTQTWAVVSYSQGQIVMADILDRCGITQGKVTKDLAAYKDSFIGAVSFGGPRREQGHTIPGGIDPGGHGIVQPQLKGTPASVWDFAAGKSMPGSPGQDLYSTSGYRGDKFTAKDESAVWEIVRHGTIESSKDLFKQVSQIFIDPTKNVPGAAVAILDALNFFVVTGIRPHTSYQLTKPIPNDPRDCWIIALDYLKWMGKNIPARS